MGGLLPAALGGCAYQGGDMANPLARRAEWFSFVGGEDLRRDCRSGADRFRLVYNGLWKEQVRIYDWEGWGARLLRQRVLGPADLTGVSLSDPLAPWRGSTAAVALSAGQYEALVAALERSGAFGRPPAGLRLPSDSFYWIAASCRDGMFHLAGWRYPGEAFDRLAFPPLLWELDRTGAAVNPPRPPGVPYMDSMLRAERERWIIEIGDNGLVGNSLF